MKTQQGPFNVPCAVCGSWTNGTDGGMIDHDIGAVCGACAPHAQVAEDFLGQAKSVLGLREPKANDKFFE